MFSFLLGLICSYIQLFAPLALGRPFPLINQSLDEITIDELNAFFKNGSLTSVDLVQTYIERTFEVNHILHAVGELNPDVLEIARTYDHERAKGRIRGPLHGIPILVKDNIATKDKMNNTAGSLALVGATVSREATVVEKLREAGAIILGKATMGEWAQCRSRKASSSHGWSGYGGQVYGAYYPGQDPSGSSSGSAVSVSVGLAIGSLATETSGSILLPAEKSNLVGIKPTLGLTSRNMVIPISIRQDTIGPLAKTVKDAAYLLSVIAGKDKHDNWTDQQPFNSPPDYVKSCILSGLKGARLGIPRNGIDPFLDETDAHSYVMKTFTEALGVITNAGATIIDEANFPQFDIDAFSRNASIVLDTDFVAGLAEYFSHLVINPQNLHGLNDVATFTKTDPREEYPERDVYVWERELTRNITNESPESWQAYQANLEMGGPQGVIGALDNHNLDALVMPTFTSFHLPAIAGLPVITVPLGYFPANTTLVMNLKGTMVSVAPNIPFGISFVGRKWSEPTLIRLAYAFEQRSRIRQRLRPSVRPTFEVKDLNWDGGDNGVSIIKTQPSLAHQSLRQLVMLSGRRRLHALQSWTYSSFGSYVPGL